MWEVTEQAARNLLECLEQLSPAAEDTDLPKPPALGYRGSWLRAPDSREWRFFGGWVKATRGKESTRLRDPGRNCERQLLQTAATGVLPPGLV